MTCVRCHSENVTQHAPTENEYVRSCVDCGMAWRIVFEPDEWLERLLNSERDRQLSLA